MTIFLYLLFESISVIFLKLAYDHKVNTPHAPGKIKKSTLYLIISFLSVAFLVCFRSISVGKDTQAYENVYNRLISGTASEIDLSWLGLGYRIICQLLGVVVGNRYYIMNIIVGFLTLYLFYKAIWNESKTPWLSLLIFISTCLYYQTFNQSRQMLAIAIMFYALIYIKKRDFRKYLIFNLLATSIHASAIIMLPFYFVCNKEINKKNIITYIMVALIIYFSMDYIRRLLLLTNYGQIYFGTQFDVEGKTSAIINFIVRMMLLLLAFILGSKDSKDRYGYLYNLAIVCTIIQMLTINTYVFGRITTYFFTTYILLIPNVIPKKNKNFWELCLFIILTLYHYVYYTATSESMGVQTYRFLFNE